MDRAGESGLSVKIGAVSVAVRTDLGDVRRDFAEMYDGCPHDPRSGDGVIQLQISRDRRWLPWRPRFSIRSGKDTIFAGRRREEVVPYIEWGINRRVIAICDRYLQLHAASLVRGGDGFIFAGESGSGKSTLAALLLGRGWTYLCDEFALVDVRSNRLQPFPKALCLKDGSFALARDKRLPMSRRAYFVDYFKRRVSYVIPRRSASVAGDGTAAIRYLIFPRYSPGAQCGLFPMTRGEASFALSPLVLNRQAFGPEVCSLVARVARSASCFRLVIGEPDETCALLESLPAQQDAPDGETAGASSD